MDKQGAEAAIVTSAIVVGGVWGYRKLIEPIATTNASQSKIKQLIGAEPTPAPAAEFLPAWGFVYLLLAVMAMMSPNTAGGMAILITTGDVLSNGLAVFTDLAGQAQPPKPAKGKH